MPELPDIVVYLEALETRILEQTLVRAAVTAPFLLRSVTPPLANVERKMVAAARVAACRPGRSGTPGI